ncbi:MAG: 2-(1,2-epoxy-1,2-dihydrophenyl)acetyl-CoA isomerase [Chloroflexi bacterium]|nr:MAG: 2-(1,2-epoxy-1,2-dihydrophenyl)acetyl-CoA isomerase [Chloroflexota bacterium]
MVEHGRATHTEQVLYQVEDSVAVITLNRPKKLNALTLAMLQALNRLLEEAEYNEAVRAVVITGAGRGFSAGQDLTEMREREEAGEPGVSAEYMEQTYHPIIRRIRRMEKPVIGGINGVAAGAGASLALACDLRIASENASFIQSFVNVGLIPDSGSTFFLPRLVGMARAMELAFTGRRVSAEEAERIGLVNRVVPHNELMDATMALARQLAQGPTKVIGMTKRALNRSWLVDIEEALDYEGELQELARATEDHHEGVTAFLEKRPAKFTGK